MVKTIIYFSTLIAVFANFVLAKDPEAFLRREVFSREDTASLQEREPVYTGAMKIARNPFRVGLRRPRGFIQENLRQTRRDLEPQDEFDLAAREDMDEFVERELDIIQEREMIEDDILGREVEEDLYLD